jgi:hypothetical protein
MTYNKQVESKTLIIALLVSAMLAAAPSLLSAIALAQNIGAANRILIDTDSRNYQCTTTTTNPAIAGLSVNAHKEGDTVKGEWNIKGTDKPGEKKGIITGGTVEKTKYDLEGKETTDSLCQGRVPKDITISGECGNNKQVNFRIIAGSHEVFNGLAECS